MFERVLVVCDGNICRSPMAEAIINQDCKGKGLTVASAGVGALVGKPVDATALQLLHENGYDHPAHEARQLTREMAQLEVKLFCLANGKATELYLTPTVSKSQPLITYIN